MRNNRGMALLMTLTIVTLLVASGLELNRRVRSAVVSTATSRDRLTLSELATSAVHVAMAMLIKDRKETTIDSIQEDWANPEKIAEVLAEIPFEAGKVKLTIRDELSKIQINALVDFPRGQAFNPSQKIMWDRFLRLLAEQQAEEADAETEIEVTAIVNSVKDWLDSEDDNAITGLNGAEEEYYQGLDPPYMPGNGPFAHVDELMQVKGMTPELFQSGKAQYGLSDYMTVYGMTKAPRPVNKKAFTYEGKININTADLPVLVAMIPSENPDYAQAIYDYRNEKEDGEFIHDLIGPWYRNVPDVPGDLTIDPMLITTSSDFFRIIAEAELNGTALTATVMVHREKEPETGKWQCRVLSWQVE